MPDAARLQTLGFVWVATLSMRAVFGAGAAETLVRADEALASVQKVEYVVACYRVGDTTFGDPSRKTIARVKQERSDADGLPFFWARVNVPRSDLVDGSRQEIAFDGKRLGVIDHDRKVCTHGAYEDAASNAGSFLSIVLFLLAQSGVVTREAVTMHWEDLADLRAQFPQLDVREGVRWVDTGRIVSSAGISAGIDMSLHLVERLAGLELAERTARQMDYAWTRNEPLSA